MFRILWFIAKLVVVIAALTWVAQQPGWINISWLGYDIDVTVGVALLALAVLIVVTAQLYRLWRGIVAMPKTLRKYHAANAREKAYQTVAQGFVAIAAGDVRTADHNAKRAEKMLPDFSLTKLLTAQSAQLRGDMPAARQAFEKLLNDKDAAFFGIRGLLQEARRTNNNDEVVALMRRAETLRPKHEWVLQTLFEHEVRSRQWDKAEKTLARARRMGAIDRDRARRHRVALMLAQSEDAGEKNNAEIALKLAKKAVRLDPHHIPAVLQTARLLAQAGKQRAAVKIIEKCWQNKQHPELAVLWGTLMPKKGKTGSEAELARFQWYRRLYDLAPHAAESRIALGDAALQAQLWGDARTHLQTARAFRLMATLEQLENNDETAARKWLELAADQAPADQWICESCAAAAQKWTPLCPVCDAFDAFTWQAPHTHYHHTKTVRPQTVEIFEPPRRLQA